MNQVKNMLVLGSSMKTRIPILICLFLGTVLLVMAGILTAKKQLAPVKAIHLEQSANPLPDESHLKSDADWKKILTPGQYHILREAGTEVPFTGSLLHEERRGTYYSIGCDEPVFRSEQKYDSQTGWPSFWAPINSDALVLRDDSTIPGSPRIEVLDKCGGHLGHVFDDGPQPTGKRYCMNSTALKFVPDDVQP